jgi:hypothetical protein
MSWKTAFERRRGAARVLTRLGGAALAAASAQAQASLAAGAGCLGASGARQAFPYPLVLRGEALLVGTPVADVMAYARRDGKWREIPVQIDEVNRKGDYVLSQGLPYTASSDDGYYDANDELVLDGADLGDDFAPGDARDLQLSRLKTLKLAVCRGAAPVGWALIAAGRAPRDPPPPAARYYRDDGEIVTSLYRYRFRKDHPALLGDVAFRAGEGFAPVLTSSRFVMPMHTPFFMPNLSFRDSDFSSRIESWQVGPLRTIVAVGVQYAAFLGLLKLHLFSELVFYRNRFVIPTEVEFVFNAKDYLSPGSGVAYALSFPKGETWTVTSNLAELPAADPKSVVQNGPRASEKPFYFAEGRSPRGAFRVHVDVDPKARAQVPPPFLLRAADFAAPAKRARWPWLADLQGDLGVFLEFSNMERGDYQFALDLLLSPLAEETFTDYGQISTALQATAVGP